MIFNLYIFNKKGHCIFYRDWNRQQPPENLPEEQKLIFGFLSAITTFVDKTSLEACVCIRAAVQSNLQI